MPSNAVAESLPSNTSDQLTQSSPVAQIKAADGGGLAKAIRDRLKFGRRGDEQRRPPRGLEGSITPQAPRSHDNLIAPLEMPVGKRPQKILPSYG